MFPVSLSVMVCVSNILTGRRICKLLTSDFLLVMMTPDFGLGLLENAVRSCLGGLQLGPLITLPIYVMDRIATRLRASGMLKKIFLIRSLVMCSSLTCDIFMCNILLMLRWRNELSLR